MPRITSTFETGTEGWSVGPGAELFEWLPDTDEITAVDARLEDFWYYVAPAAYIGDQSDKYLTPFSVSIAQDRDDDQADAPADIVIEGRAGTLVWDGFGVPGSSPETYTVELAPGQGWIYDDGFNTFDAIAGDFEAVLADVTAVRVLGEFRNGDDRSFLDEVSWGSGTGPGGGSGAVFSDFDAGTEGWTAVNGVIDFFADSEGANGFVTAIDDIGASGVGYFSAPGGFLGDRRDLEGSTFTWRIRQDRTDEQFAADDVILRGSAGDLLYRAPQPPGFEFTDFEAEIAPDEGWVFAAPGGFTRDATASDFSAVLGDLDGVFIRADYRDGDDTVSLDEAGFVARGGGDGGGVPGAEIVGTPGADTLDGTAGDDVIFPGTGDDDIFAGAGQDTVVIDLPRGEATVSRGPQNLIVVTSPEGVDLLAEVERIAFDDGVEIFDAGGPFDDLVYRLYAASYARTPDEDGFRFWNDYMTETADEPDDLAGFFIGAPEFAERYGASPTDRQFVDALYENVLLRSPDQAGFEFWLDEFASGRQDRADMLVAFAESPENVGRTEEFLDVGTFVI